PADRPGSKRPTGCHGVLEGQYPHVREVPFPIDLFALFAPPGVAPPNSCTCLAQPENCGSTPLSPQSECEAGNLYQISQL
ncbi:MAG: hypothetical protein ACKO3P_12625, partial [Planctomycetaceae bacterium]